MQIVIICNLIREVAKHFNKPATDAECGLHIHFDASDIRPKHLSNLFQLLHIAEPIIYAMYPMRNFKYCAPISVNIRQASRFRDWLDVRDAWYRGSNNVRDHGTVYEESFINSNEAGDNYDGTRYHGFNIHCFWKIGTLEFRYCNGTIDALHIMAYYELCLGLINSAINGIKPAALKLSDKKYNELKLFYNQRGMMRYIVNFLGNLCSLSKESKRLIVRQIKKNSSELIAKKSDKDDKVAGEIYLGSDVFLSQSNCSTIFIVDDAENYYKIVWIYGAYFLVKLENSSHLPDSVHAIINGTLVTDVTLSVKEKGKILFTFAIIKDTPTTHLTFTATNTAAVTQF